MSRNDIPRAGPMRGSVLAVATLTLLMLAAPMAAAVQHGANVSDPNSTAPDPGVSTSGCPDDLSSVEDTDAFSRAGVSAPAASTQTEVTCSGGIVLTATAAKELIPGETYVVFFTLHDADRGEIVDAPFIQVNLTGAAAPGSDTVPEVAASVNGTDGLKAVRIAPPSTGQATLTVELPRDLTILEVSFDVADAGTSPADETLGANIPGFGAVAVLAGLLVVALVLRRRPPKLMAVALAATLVATPAMAHAGGGHEEGKPVDVQFIPHPDGLSFSTDGLDVSLASEVDQPETSFDLGDLTTAAGPSADHTYAEPGAYLVQLVAYDPATLTGTVSDRTIGVGNREANQNQPPTATVTASTRWTTYGGNVTLSAGDRISADGDNHAFLWAVGRSPVGEADYTYTLEAVTAEPEWSWTAPDGDTDYRFEVFAVDSRRGITNASTQVRVTEELPSETETFGPFKGQLDCPAGTPVSDQCTSSREHPFTMAYDGTVNATLRFTTSNGQDPQGGVPDVDMAIGQESATGTGSPDTLQVDLAKGDRDVLVWLADGLDASYSVEIEARYELNPFA